jgi:hypothetical protein
MKHERHYTDYVDYGEHVKLYYSILRAAEDEHNALRAALYQIGVLFNANGRKFG